MLVYSIYPGNYSSTPNYSSSSPWAPFSVGMFPLPVRTFSADEVSERSKLEHTLCIAQPHLPKRVRRRCLPVTVRVFAVEAHGAPVPLTAVHFTPLHSSMLPVLLQVMTYPWTCCDWVVGVTQAAAPLSG